MITPAGEDLKRLQEQEAFVTKDGSVIRELLSHRNSAIRNQSLAEATIPAGQRTDAHYHRVTEEIYFITAGSGIMHLGSKSFSVSMGDAIAIPPGTVHCIEAHADQDLVLLCCCAPAYEHDDTVMVPEV